MMRAIPFLLLLPLLFSCEREDELSPDDLSSCAAINNGWSAVSEPYTGYHYPEDIAFGTPEVAVAVGKAGQISRSVDGGLTWSEVTSSIINPGVRNDDAITTARLTTVVALDESLFYAAGSDEDARRSGGDIETDAVFLTSTDGGLSWTKRYLEGFNYVFDLHFTDPEHGFAIARQDEIVPEATSWLFSTEDGGQNWTPLEIPYERPHTYRRFSEHPGAVSVIAQNSNDDGVLLTFNGATGNFDDRVLPQEYIEAVEFVTTNFGIVRGAEQFWITTDGGNSWESNNFGEATGAFALYASDAENWLAIKQGPRKEGDGFEEIGDLLYYEVLTTDNAGNDWSIQKVATGCDYELLYRVQPTRTPDGGFLTVTSRANLIRFNG